MAAPRNEQRFIIDADFKKVGLTRTPEQVYGNGDVYYLISQDWYKDWSNIIFYDQKSAQIKPISNNFVIEDEVTGHLVVPPTVDSKAYRGLPEEAWNHFTAWYASITCNIHKLTHFVRFSGGPKITRRALIPLNGTTPVLDVCVELILLYYIEANAIYYVKVHFIRLHFIVASQGEEIEFVGHFSPSILVHRLVELLCQNIKRPYEKGKMSLFTTSPLALVPDNTSFIDKFFKSNQLLYLNDLPSSDTPIPPQSLKLVCIHSRFNTS